MFTGLSRVSRVVPTGKTHVRQSRESQAPCENLCLLNFHGSAVAQDFGDCLHDLGRVIAHADYAIRPCFRRVLQHPLESIAPGLLAQLCIESNVAADQCLQARTETVIAPRFPVQFPNCG
jgi:hypothetical protein